MVFGSVVNLLLSILIPCKLVKFPILFGKIVIWFSSNANSVRLFRFPILLGKEVSLLLSRCNICKLVRSPILLGKDCKFALFIANIVICVSLIQFSSTANAKWLLPWIIKSLSDFYLTYNYCTKINQNWNIYDCLILSLIHPFYIVIFGVLGPFLKVKWK